MKTYNKEFPTSKRFIYTKKFKALIWLFCPKISPTLSKTAPFRVSMLTTSLVPRESARVQVRVAISLKCWIPLMISTWYRNEYRNYTHYTDHIILNLSTAVDQGNWSSLVLSHLSLAIKARSKGAQWMVWRWKEGLEFNPNPITHCASILQLRFSRSFLCVRSK